MRSKIITLPALFIFLLLTLIFSFERCTDKCQVKNKYVYFSPVYSTTAAIKAAVEEKPAREIKNLGKIYFKDGILFLNEVGEGIHIIDNHDPAQPRPVAFLSVPGNLDLAIQGNTLYADSYVDLVSFDISNLHSIKEISRIEGLFTIYDTYGSAVDPERGVITSWKTEESISIVESECSSAVQPWGGIYYGGGIAFMQDKASPNSAMISPSNSTGVGGSMARFTIVNQYLYGLDGSNLDVVDITNESHPVAGTSISAGWGAQTLFPYKNNLFVGGRAGMYIFDLSTPDQPKLISQYEHIQSCDPVVVEGDYAYVTLYSGDLCHVDTDQLEVIDIKDLTKPTLVKIYPMTNPHGLGISNGTLFICDGVDGLKIFDATDPLSITDHSLAHYDKISALDIIPFDNIAMMISSEGIYQYDYSDVKNIKFLSHISIAKQ